MKKWIGFVLGLVAAALVVAAVIGVLRQSHGTPGKKVKALFSEKDFSVLPMEERVAE